MKKLRNAAIGLGALAGLALLIQSGEPTTASAAQSVADTPVTTQKITGRLVNLPAEYSCNEAAGTPACSFDIKGIGVSHGGELIQRTIMGTFHGAADQAGEVSPNRSYAIWEYPDGSTMLLESAGTTAVNGADQRIGAGTQTCVAGTGRFADVDCTINWSLMAQPNGPYVGTYNGTVSPKVLS